ncbi:MAG: hemerythrin family protein [Treponema sp.]|nr:hemerythrin family protein [Treponema sp.]
MHYEWTKDLETGHSAIDGQHKDLIAALNSLMDAIESGKGSDAVSSSLNFLSDYTIRHFFEEEKLQQKYNYPDYPNHKKIHDNFKAVIHDLKVREMWKGSSDELVNEVRDKIGSWLVTHIKGQDVKIAAYIRSVSKDSAAP